MSTPAKAKSRLGRGLSALISMSDVPVDAAVPEPQVPSTSAAPPASATAPQPAVAPTELPTSAVLPNPHQPRKQFNEAALLSLAASLKSTGLVQPIVVRNNGDGQYQLIAGERRLRAAKLAGLATVPVILRDVNPFEQAQMALIENIQREDLNPIDRAQAYRTLIDQLGLTQSELANRVGEDRSSIANYLRLLDLCEPVRELVRNGQLSMGHAKILAGISDPAQQQELAERVLGQDLSVRNLERILQEPAAAPAPRMEAEPSAHLKDLENRLTSQLGLRVQLRAGARKGRGRVVIHYGSLDEFDQLMERLALKPE
jgi:ParB family chromosome partitioning protein